MAAADPPAGLMDIASTLSQDEIPFKLRCAICSKLAINAFRLPCCDQSICETCQASLSDTCPVCAHTPVSPDLCKPNKALRTTLKAFLRTEEKKREKDRQATAPPTPPIPTPTESEQPAVAATEQKTSEVPSKETSEVLPPTETKPDEVATEAPPTETAADNAVDGGAPGSADALAESEPAGDQVPEAGSVEANTNPTDGDAPDDDESTPSAPQDLSQPAGSSMMNMGPGGFPGMGWNGNGNFNGMNPFMANAMFNFPNPIGMPMTMDPMAANQGMFGDYGMNMTGMGMSMGMNFNGQGMYGSLGWDGSQQNMWHGGQDKFNPNAFANGTGPPYGGAFGGSNQSYPSNPDFQSGYYGPGYGRGGFRGRGRGHFHGPSRGRFGSHSAHSGYSNQLTANEASGGAPVEPAVNPQAGENAGAEQVSEPTGADGNGEVASSEQGSADIPGQQLQGIPTVDNVDLSVPTGPSALQGPMGPGYGRGGYMRGVHPGGRGGLWGGPMNGAYQPHLEQPRGPGVEGAPAAPLAMRQGLPNTSVLRQRGFHAQGRASVGSSAPGLSQRGNSEAPQESTPQVSPSKAPSQAQRAGSRSRSPTTHGTDGDQESRRENEVKRDEREPENHIEVRRSHSPSRMSSRRSSRRRHRDSDRDRRNGHRPHRSRRHQSRSDSRSRSPSRDGDSRHPDRLAHTAEGKEPNGHGKTSSETGGTRDLASRISSHRSGKEWPSRCEEDRDRDRDRARDSRRRDRDRERDRDRDRRDQDRDSERDRRRRDRDRGRAREKDRKRSRRDRSESANAADHSSRPQARRAKREAGESRDGPKASEPEKDPYTLEREARNRERMLREQQNRGGTKAGTIKSSRREGRQERMVGGRRINYKYEDEL